MPKHGDAITNYRAAEVSSVDSAIKCPTIRELGHTPTCSWWYHLDFNIDNNE